MQKVKAIAVSLGSLVAVAVVGYFVYDLYILSKKIEGPEVDPGQAAVRAERTVPAMPYADVTKQAGLNFKHFCGATGNKLLPETMGSGVVVLDYNNDGLPDLFFVNSCPWPGHPEQETAPTLALYRNNGNGTFTDATAETGLKIALYGQGACAGDFDNDGFIDLFVTCVGSHRLFKNINGTHFEDVTTKAGVAGNGAWPAELSQEAFLAHAPPIPFGTSATFVDYDGDALLDLFVCHYCTWSPAIDLSIKTTLKGVGRTYQQPTSLEGNQCRLYRNRGDGTFEDVSQAAGVLVYESEGTDANARQRSVGKSLGVIVCDPDRDGWPDLIVANDTVRNFFFHNVALPDGSRGFKEKGLSANVAYADSSPRGAMGIDVGEMENGKMLVLIANFANEPNTLLTMNNPSRLLFTDAANATGLFGPSRGPLKFGAFFFDADLDSRLDLLTCNGHIDPDISIVQPNQTHAQAAQFYWNTGDLFEPVKPSSAGEDLFRPMVGRGSAYLDYDNDGDLDLVLTENNSNARLLRNEQTLGHHWLRLELQGDGATSNRSAIGAEVTLHLGDKKLTRTITGARGYLSQSELTLTFGLGSATAYDKIVVRWPGKNAKPETYTGLAIDTKHVLKQGNGQSQE